MKEVEAYRRFHHENIIRCMDSCVVSDHDGGKIIYIFLPYYKVSSESNGVISHLHQRGNLQDAIAANVVNHNNFPQLEMLKLFRGVCYAIRSMHTYTLPSVPLTNENEDDMNNAEASLMAGDANANSAHVLGQEADEESGMQADGTPGDVIPYAHRDIKPGNVMIADDGITPILMDFGSAIRARTRIDTRQQALLQQDLAAEQSTMPYRAPELFDVKTGATIDEKVDIWSLGCLLFAMAYGLSPFETSQTDQGGSMALAVLNGQYKFPPGNNDPYSDVTRNLIKALLVVDPANRPDIHKTISLVDDAISSLNS